MAAHSRPRIETYKAGGAITRGKAVKYGADGEHVVQCTAATDKSIGLAYSSAAQAEDLVEVALPGGGAKALLQTTVSAGMALVPHTDGSLKPIAAANNRVICVTKEDGVAGDLAPVEVLIFQATATES